MSSARNHRKRSKGSYNTARVFADFQRKADRAMTQKESRGFYKRYSTGQQISKEENK